MTAVPLRVLGLVPARSGSKGVPGKNTRCLGGRPLLVHTALAAVSAERLSAVVLSTDSQEIADLGLGAGLEVPFIRPDHLALDDTPSLPVVQHAIDALAAGGREFDAVCLLQPTSPIRPEGLIDACIDRLATSDADSVVTVRPLPDEHHPAWAFVEDLDGALRLYDGSPEPTIRRQDLAPAFVRDGAVYVTRVDVIIGGSLYGRRTLGVVGPEHGINIDSEHDWARAEALFETG
jgi:CMP-N,N'-diacetyllegionaminic acid synthase